MFSGDGAEVDRDVAAAALRQRLRQARRHVVGLAQLLAEDVAERDFEDVAAAATRVCSVVLDRRVGEEAQDRLRPGLAALLDDARSVVAGKLDTEIGELWVALPVDGSEPT